MSWKTWKPELNNDLTLKQVLELMPRNDPKDIPWQIKIFENPKSPISLPGAVSLFRHDCIHALLCTSFYSECEAWTIGFTMGTHTNLKNWQIILFKIWASFYPGNYKMDKNDKIHFHEGLEYGKKSKIKNISNVPFEFDYYQNMKMKQLRKIFQFDWIDETHEYEQWAFNRWRNKF